MSASETKLTIAQRMVVKGLEGMLADARAGKVDGVLALAIYKGDLLSCVMGRVRPVEACLWAQAVVAASVAGSAGIVGDTLRAEDEELNALELDEAARGKDAENE